MVAEGRSLEAAGDVREILCRLPACSQVVLNLYYLEGFGLAEMAEILGIPAGTVKSRLHTARSEFRKHWESLGGMQLAAIPASGKE
jgi:RNA polymerase sigma-70 factor (ECF subfamily)